MGNSKSKQKEIQINSKAPGLLVLIKDPKRCPELILFGQTFAPNCSICYATVLINDDNSNALDVIKHKTKRPDFLLPHDAYKSIISTSLPTGIQCLLQSLKTESFNINATVIGYHWYPQNWHHDKNNEYVDILNNKNNGLIICRGLRRINWLLKSFIPPLIDPGNTYYDLIAKQYSVNKHQWDYNGNIIDVWCIMNDDLCLLIPYIMSIHIFWKSCKLRLRMISNVNLNCMQKIKELISGFIRQFENKKQMEQIIPNSIVLIISKFFQKETCIDTDILNAQKIISAFNLSYSEPEVFEVNDNPHPKTIEMFEELAQCKLEHVQSNMIKKWLLVSELLCIYSRYTGINVVSLPHFTDDVSPRIHMSLLYMLSHQSRLPPTLMIRK